LYERNIHAEISKYKQKRHSTKLFFFNKLTFKQDVMVLAGFIRLRIGISGRLLVNMIMNLLVP
jgi:hypothetical protein